MALRHLPVVLQGNLIVDRPCIQVGTIHFFFLGVLCVMLCVVDPDIEQYLE